MLGPSNPVIIVPVLVPVAPPLVALGLVLVPKVVVPLLNAPDVVVVATATKGLAAMPLVANT